MKRRDPRIEKLLTTAGDRLRAALQRYQQEGEDVDLFERLIEVKYLIKEAERALLMDELLRLTSDPQEDDPGWQKQFQAVTQILVKEAL